LVADGKQIRLALDGLRVLQGLPLEVSRRLLLGARLQDVQVGPKGEWVVHLEAGSGVLLTDPDAARLCCPALADAESSQLLRQQRAWVVGEEAAAPGIQKK
jgi:hypothetical protein